jgi:hypothetical protein
MGRFCEIGICAKRATLRLKRIAPGNREEYLAVCDDHANVDSIKSHEFKEGDLKSATRIALEE